MARVIKKNAAQCVHCGDTVESTSPSKVTFCSCRRVAVSGGKESVVRFETEPCSLLELSEWEIEPDEESEGRGS